MRWCVVSEELTGARQRCVKEWRISAGLERSWVCDDSSVSSEGSGADQFEEVVAVECCQEELMAQRPVVSASVVHGDALPVAPVRVGGAEAQGPI
jgi:hypothetical protein